MLSADQILSKSLKAASLPVSGGAKDFSPNDSEEQKKSLAATLEQYQNVLKEERITRKLNLSVACWDSALALARVEVQKGSHFHKFGYATRDGVFLKPEEALFLLDQGVLELLYDGYPLSVQEAYILILPFLPSHEYYQVFAYLCKLGYSVTRHNTCDVVRQSLDEESSCQTGLNDKDVLNDPDEDFEPMASGYVKNLWIEDVKPCVKPEDARSTASILSKLQIIKTIKPENVPILPSLADKFQIDFDVFTSKLSKRSREEPSFCIVVCKYDDPPPSLAGICKISQQSNGVNTKLAVVNQGTVTFYGLFNVDLPTNVSPLG